MPRARQNIYDRLSHFWGKLSGVTIESNPSGTTIYKSGVTATTIKATTVSATTLKGTTLKNAGGTGYVLPFYNTSGLLMAAGRVGVTSGVTKIEAAYFGMTAIRYCVATVGVSNLMNKTGTSCHVFVTVASSFPDAGVSRVYFRVKDGGGAAVNKPVSVQYFAVGI